MAENKKISTTALAKLLGMESKALFDLFVERKWVNREAQPDGKNLNLATCLPSCLTDRNHLSRAVVRCHPHSPCHHGPCSQPPHVQLQGLQVQGGIRDLHIRNLQRQRIGMDFQLIQVHIVVARQPVQLEAQDAARGRCGHHALRPGPLAVRFPVYQRQETVRSALQVGERIRGIHPPAVRSGLEKGAQLGEGSRMVERQRHDHWVDRCRPRDIGYVAVEGIRDLANINRRVGNRNMPRS